MKLPTPTERETWRSRASQEVYGAEASLIILRLDAALLGLDIRAKATVPELAYKDKLANPHKGWDQIAAENDYLDARSAYSAVGRWARANGAPWPIPSTTPRRKPRSRKRETP